MKRNTTYWHDLGAVGGKEAMGRREFLKAVGATAAAASVGGLGLLWPPRAEGATQRPISEFVAAQQFRPPIPPYVTPAFFGWSPLSGQPLGVIDYAGVTNPFLLSKGIDLGTAFAGSVTERPLADGSAEVSVLLRTRNAFAHAEKLPVTSAVVYFGYTDYEINADPSINTVAVGDSLLQVVFRNTAPGAPLPDLHDASWLTLSFRGTATGPLRAAFGVPEGTPGRMTISETGLIATYGKANPNSRVGYDAFPAELVNLQVVGR